VQPIARSAREGGACSFVKQNSSLPQQGLVPFATQDQSEVISDDYRWRRWESKTSDFAPIQATTGNHRKPDPELAETKDEKKHVRESALPTGKIERDTTEGRVDVGELPTAETLGTLARKVLSSSRHAESRELACAVLRLLAGSKKQP